MRGEAGEIKRGVFKHQGRSWSSIEEDQGSVWGDWQAQERVHRWDGETAVPPQAGYQRGEAETSDSAGRNAAQVWFDILILIIYYFV